MMMKGVPARQIRSASRNGAFIAEMRSAGSSGVFAIESRKTEWTFIWTDDGVNAACPGGPPSWL